MVSGLIRRIPGPRRTENNVQPKNSHICHNAHIHTQGPRSVERTPISELLEEPNEIKEDDACTGRAAANGENSH